MLLIQSAMFLSMKIDLPCALVTLYSVWLHGPTWLSRSFTGKGLLSVLPPGVMVLLIPLTRFVCCFPHIWPSNHSQALGVAGRSIRACRL